MKPKKIIYLVVLISLGIFIVCNSIYIENLETKRQRDMIKNFNPKEMVDYFWKNQLDKILSTAIELKTFDSLLNNDSEGLIQKYGHAVGITSNYCFLVKGKSIINRANTEKLYIDFTGNKNYSLLIKYIFSNTARDALGYFKVDDFENTMDFNAISSELNSRIINEVIPEKNDTINAGSSISFFGAIEINSNDLIKEELDIVPLKMNIINNDQR
jgi:predicted lipoprotein